MIRRGLRRMLAAGLLLPGAALPGQEPGSASTLALTLNVPAYRIDVRDSSGVVMRVRVAVGSRQYPTPTGRFGIRTITWNPWWYPPASPWAAGDTITPPCPQNPVGKVKLGFAPRYFIHGTPQPRSIGRPASHGCVRVRQEDAVALAALIVRHMLPDSVAAAAAYASGNATRSMRLPAPVPIEIVYRLAEVSGDSLWMYPDPYRRAATQAERRRQARLALRLSGRDTLAVSDEQLRRLARESVRRAVALPLAAPPS